MRSSKKVSRVRSDAGEMTGQGKIRRRNGQAVRASLERRRDTTFSEIERRRVLQEVRGCKEVQRSCLMTSVSSVEQEMRACAKDEGTTVGSFRRLVEEWQVEMEEAAVGATQLSKEEPPSVQHCKALYLH